MSVPALCPDTLSGHRQDARCGRIVLNFSRILRTKPGVGCGNELPEVRWFSLRGLRVQVTTSTCCRRCYIYSRDMIRPTPLFIGPFPGPVGQEMNRSVVRGAGIGGSSRNRPDAALLSGGIGFLLEKMVFTVAIPGLSSSEWQEDHQYSTISRKTTPHTRGQP